MPDQVNWEPARREAPGHMVGCILRDQREAHGLGVDDVKKRLRIQRPYIEAIEDGRFEDLPGAAYVPAYLRAYALDIGLDPEKVLAAYNASGPLPIKRPTAFPVAHPDRVMRAWVVVGVFVTVLLVVGTILAFGLSKHGFGHYFSGQ